MNPAPGHLWGEMRGGVTRPYRGCVLGEDQMCCCIIAKAQSFESTITQINDLHNSYRTQPANTSLISTNFRQGKLYSSVGSIAHILNTNEVVPSDGWRLMNCWLFFTIEAVSPLVYLVWLCFLFSLPPLSFGHCLPDMMDFPLYIILQS